MHFDSTLDKLADDLLRARDTAQLIKLPSQIKKGFDLTQGYQLGNMLHERIVGRGAISVGRKIGFTNPATWKEFNLDTPIWAHMYEKTVHFADKNRFSLPLAGMAAPRIEPEVVVKLKSPLASSDLSEKTLVDCLEWVAIGFEIVDSHYPEWCFTAADAVADFGVHAALVVGTPWQVNSENAQKVITQLKALRVILRRGANIFAEGIGSNALGSPLLAISHLAQVLEAQSWAQPLTSGEIITTGTLTPLPYVCGGESWSVEIIGAPLAPLKMDLSD